MDSDARRLWHRIEAWPLSDADRPLEFECRLAHECGWTLGHAIGVVREYRRYLLLTQVQSGGAPPRPVEPVAPSADVDAAWHLHLARTSDYERFCFAALGRFLHHHPSRGGADELARHRHMYARTLDVYRDVFDEEPPATIWPGVDARFSAAARHETAPAAVRADSVARLLVLVGGIAVAAALALACAATGLLAPLRAIAGPQFALGYLVMLSALALVGFAPATIGKGTQVRDAVDPYELAWLVGGARRMAATAVVSLVDAGRARLVAAIAPTRAPGRSRRQGAPVPTRIVAEAAFASDTPPLHAAERAVLQAALAQSIDFPAACRAAAPEAAVVAQRLQGAGLARDRDLLDSRRLNAFALALLLLAIVLERLAHAIEVQRAVGLLMTLLVLHLFLAGALVMHRVRLTRRGRAVLDRMRRAVPRPQPRKLPSDPRSNVPFAGLLAAVALFGAPAVMADPRFAGIEHAMGREGLASGGGDSGSGCSGGGDGGGCGGCGGD